MVRKILLREFYLWLKELPPCTEFSIDDVTICPLAAYGNQKLKYEECVADTWFRSLHNFDSSTETIKEEALVDDKIAYSLKMVYTDSIHRSPFYTVEEILNQLEHDWSENLTSSEEGV